MFAYEDSSEHERASCFRILICSGYVFFVLYNISFRFNEGLTSGRVAVILAFLYVLLTYKAIPLYLLKTRAWLLFLPFPYVVVQYYFVGDSGQLSRFLNLAVYSYFASYFLVLLARSHETLFLSFLIAITIQSSFLFFSFFSLEYRIWFDAIVVTGANYDPNYLYRAPGFSSNSGAALSVIQSLGVLSGWLLLARRKYFSPLSSWGGRVIVLFMFVCAASCLVVGRTGFLLSLIFFVLFFVSSGRYFSSLLFFSSVGGLVVFFVSLFSMDFLSDAFSVDYFLKWALGVFTGRDETISVLASMPIPKVSEETFWGTGLVSLVDGVNPSGHDSGLVQAYYSMGLPVAVLLYLMYVYVLFFCLREISICFRVLLVCVFLGLELKEPFLFKYSVVFVLNALLFCGVYSGFRNKREFYSL